MNAVLELDFQHFIESKRITRPGEIVLINPQMIPEDNFDLTIAENKGYYAFPPIGLLSLAKVAREIDPNVRLRVLDLNYEMLKRSQSPGFNYKFWQDYVY